MAEYKIVSKYDVGNIVAFEHGGFIAIGKIVSLSIDDQNWWYDIQLSKGNVRSYGNGGDVAEWDILGLVTQPELVECFNKTD